jgi:hypothetical protein
VRVILHTLYSVRQHLLRNHALIIGYLVAAIKVSLYDEDLCILIVSTDTALSAGLCSAWCADEELRRKIRRFCIWTVEAFPFSEIVAIKAVLKYRIMVGKQEISSMRLIADPAGWYGNSISAAARRGTGS